MDARDEHKTITEDRNDITKLGPTEKLVGRNKSGGENSGEDSSNSCYIYFEKQQVRQ